jgi:multidrug resistance efflux pump
MDQTRSALGARLKPVMRPKQAAVGLINAPPRTEDIAMAKANLALAQTNLEDQSAQFAKTQLRSPIDGVVLRRYFRPGEVISIQPPTPRASSISA